MHRGVVRRCFIQAARLLAGGAAIIALGGCWPFSRGPTPQERYYAALNRRDTVAAAQIWTQMSPKDRAKLQRGEGVSPEFTRQMLQDRLTNPSPALDAGVGSLPAVAPNSNAPPPQGH